MSTLLQIDNISKSYGSHPIFSGANLSVGMNQKIGVIGRNGAGKSTLFRIIVGTEEADSGNIIIGKKTRLGYLEQLAPYKDNETVISFLMRYSGKEEWECGKVGGRFQLKTDRIYAEIGSLSGGYQMRVKLTAMLLKEPNLLLLDEPTNYLDLSTLILLEGFLQSYNKSFLIISHDREFLKNTCQETVEVEHEKVFFYPRPLEEYFGFKEEQLQLKEQHNKNIERKQKQLQDFVDRFRTKASKAAQAQSKLKQIGKLKRIDITHPLSNVRIHIPSIETKKGIAVSCEEMTIGYGDKAIAKGITISINRGEHIAIVGNNGQGKTTFLKTLAGEIPALEGSLSWNKGISFSYYAQHVPSSLNPDEVVEKYLFKSVSKDVNDEEVLKMAGNFLFKGTSLKKKISVLSGGERARLCLASILLKKSDVLLLDEPENHLDFETVESLGAALKESNATVIFISHNRTFVNVLAKGIVEVKNGKVLRYHHNYEEYVYSLSQELAENSETKAAKSQKRAVKDNTQKKALNSSLRNKQKELKKLENKINRLHKEKESILKEFAEEPHTYSQSKSELLERTERAIEEKEEEWLIAHEEIEELLAPSGG